MTKEKLLSLSRYISDMKSKLDSAIPDKHKNRAQAYRNFLIREIRIHTDKLEAHKILSTTQTK